MITLPATDVVISGVGETAYVRGTPRTAKQLIFEAATLACADAGVPPSAIDGVVLPTTAVTSEDLTFALAIPDLRAHATVSMGGAGAASATALAAGIVSGGHATRVLVPLGTASYSGSRRISDASGKALNQFVWPSQAIRTHIEYPAGFSVPMQWYSLHANRWFHETGADPIGMRTVALSTRQHAHSNSRAYFRGRELTVEAYETAPALTRPFRLFDVSMESDGAAALVVERAATEASGRARQVHVAGGGEGHPDTADDLSSRASVLETGTRKVGRRVFEALGVKPHDFDFAELYDCFTFIVLRQLEELGFCEVGESPEWLRDHEIGPGGDFPINTHGGLLSQAHIAGMNHIAEAVKQLRGDAEAPVEGARLGLVTGYGDFSDGSLLVLSA